MWAALVCQAGRHRGRFSPTVPWNRRLSSCSIPRNRQSSRSRSSWNSTPGGLLSGASSSRSPTRASAITLLAGRFVPAGSFALVNVHLPRHCSGACAPRLKSVHCGAASWLRLHLTSENISSRTFCSASSPGNYDGWTSTVQSDDGRTFTFATVVAEDASSAATPLAVWDHACSLIGGPPTAAVAFVSHPTAGAIQAIADLSACIADVSSRQVVTPEGDASEPSGTPAIIGCVADGWTGYAGDSTAARWKSRMGQALQSAATSRQRGRPGKGALPLSSQVDVGDWIRLAALLDSGKEESDDRKLTGEQSTRELLRQALQGSGSDAGGRVKGWDESSQNTLEEWNRTKEGDEVAGLGEVDLSTLGLDKVLGLIGGGELANRDEGEDSVEDWIQLCDEYDDAQARGFREEDPDTWDLDLFTSQSDGDKGSGQGLGQGSGQSLRQGLGNTKQKVRKGSERERESKVRLQTTEDLLLTESALGQSRPNKSKSTRSILVNSAEGTKQSPTDIANAEPGEVERVVGEILVGGGPGGELGSKQKFRLQLCLAHMPGVKATSFFSTGPTLPYLPDMEKAVVEDNPHMLIFGAPGFAYVEYIQRLQSIFPASSRAAMFLYPLFNTASALMARGGRRERVGGNPVFYGPHVTYAGAVGIAFNSQEGASRVPMAAFAEFVRMALAFPRLHGLIFLDDNGCRQLFKPRLTNLDFLNLPPLTTESGPLSESSSGTSSSKREGKESASIVAQGGKQTEGQTEGKQKNWVEQLAPYLTKGASRSKPNLGVDGSSPNGSSPYAMREASLPANEEAPGGPSNKGSPRATSRKPRAGTSDEAPGGASQKLGGLSTSTATYSSPLFVGETSGARGVERSWEDENGERLLPLAVLGAVPFPGWTLNFNIFEPRFRLMVRQCLETESPCGIAALLPDMRRPQLIGTTATLQVERFESDYRSLVEVHGRRRFRTRPSEVMIQAGSFGLNLAKVEYFDDAPVETESERRELQRLAKRTCTLCNRVVEEVLELGGEVGMRFLNPWLLNDPVAASFAVAHVLPVENDVKLRWLLWTDTRMRLLEQMHFLKALAHRK